MSVTDVLDHLHAVAPRDRQNAVHVRRMPGVVHDDDRTRVRADPVLDIVRVDAESVRVDIGKVDGRTEVQCAGARGPVRHAWADDLVAGTDAAGPECGQQRTGAVREAQRVPAAEPLGELRLELLGNVVGRHAAAAEHVQHGVFVSARDDGPVKEIARIGGDRLRAAQQGE